MYDFKNIEKKWQEKWYKEKSFRAVDFHPTKPKYYVLYEFFSISGNLHMGHLKGTVPADALARMKRFQGYNVLFPIGGDSFGLPAENAAIKTSINPHDFVKKGMSNALYQARRLGFSFDYDRTFCTSDEDYYKWTQWIFLQLFKKGLAYKEKGIVNYCPTCKTVLSNEDSQNGECDRCHGRVRQEERSVWFLKMRDYAEKLLGNIDRIDMSENLKELARNWIGKSEGTEISFEIYHGTKIVDTIQVYTTHAETIYGTTFLTVAPEHKFIDKNKKYIENFKEVSVYRRETAYHSQLDRMSDRNNKTGVRISGLYAKNPLTKEDIPIYTSDFVLVNHGTGAIMGVPACDERDRDFAKKFNITTIEIIDSHDDSTSIDFQNKKLINSQEFSGISIREAKEKIIDKLSSMNVGQKKIDYKMQDWSFNRQRYWGEPFPIVFCDKCGIVPVPEEELPIVLPITDDYLPNEEGDSPLSKIEEWVNCRCPKCGGNAKRETDTMPNWAGSSWYWLRYVDAHNDNALADIKKIKYWGSVDCYTGGTEHITRHLLYAFFWQNFLYEIGVVPSRDPFIRKMGSGLILDKSGKKMSKSSTNGVSPIEVIGQYGSDVSRLHTHFLAAYEDNIVWTTDGINGIITFIERVWQLQDIIKGIKISDEHIYEINAMIKKVSEDIEKLKLNTCIATFMSFVKKVREDKFITEEELRIFLILLNPLAPHITSEIYERVFSKNIIDDTWPQYDERYLQKDSSIIAIQVNGKTKKVIEVFHSPEQDELIAYIEKKYPNIIPKPFDKVIYIQNKIINFVCK